MRLGWFYGNDTRFDMVWMVMTVVTVVTVVAVMAEVLTPNDIVLAVMRMTI